MGVRNIADVIMAVANGALTKQVRSIADVATAIAKGDLSREITVDVNGESLQFTRKWTIWIS